MRSLIFEIRPSTLDYLGLLPTLDDYLNRLEQATGIRPTFRSELGARLESGMETLIYRLVQELLSNVRKHSQARTVTIELREGARMADVISELRGKLPGLEGHAFRSGENRLADLYKFNLNGTLYYDGMDFQVDPGDRLALLTLVTGG